MHGSKIKCAVRSVHTDVEDEQWPAEVKVISALQINFLKDVKFLGGFHVDAERSDPGAHRVGRRLELNARGMQSCRPLEPAQQDALARAENNGAQAREEQTLGPALAGRRAHIDAMAL